jgi:hypothetical protein
LFGWWRNHGYLHQTAVTSFKPGSAIRVTSPLTKSHTFLKDAKKWALQIETEMDNGTYGQTSNGTMKLSTDTVAENEGSLRPSQSFLNQS